MTILVLGTVRLPPEKLGEARGAMEAMMTASRAEDGCITYSYGFDVEDAGLIRVFEVWRDQAAVDAHFKAPHMATWRAAGAELGVFDRKLALYEVASERAL